MIQYKFLLGIYIRGDDIPDVRGNDVTYILEGYITDIMGDYISDIMGYYKSYGGRGGGGMVVVM